MPPLDLAPGNPNGLELAAPLIAAAGCLGYGLEHGRAFRLEGLGALVTPTTSLNGRRGAPPRIWETPAGIVHNGAWADRGLEYVLSRCEPVWRTWPTRVLLSIAADARSALVIAGRLESVEAIAGLEVTGDGADLLATVEALRPVTLLPILAKLPADAPQPAELARMLVAAGADTLVVAGPPRACAVDAHSGAIQEGVLCGPAWQPIALRLLHEVLGAVEAPVVASGGIGDADAAQQAIGAGARAVQIGSALLGAPHIVAEIAQRLEGE